MTNKIIMKLAGGLGNQMFQYALGRRLSLERNFRLYLDPNGLQNYAAPRKYKLNRFNISATLVNREFTLNLPTRILTSASQKTKFDFLKIAYKIFPRTIYQIKEKNLSYDPECLNISRSCYLNGYWQNEKYFIAIKETLIKDFSLTSRLSTENNPFYESIFREQAISVHIRRGDYVSNKENLSYYSICDINYYKEAISILLRSIKNPHLFIFSDGIPWVKENLEFPLPVTYVEGNSVDQDIEELFLMTQCKYHVIANSSFSWWGAWLCTYPGQIVIAPKHWFIDDGMNKQLELPEQWIRI